MIAQIKIVLIGNYIPDNQESMLRFALLLDSAFCNAKVSSEIWWPTVLFGRYTKTTNNGFGKWLGYFDKYIVFPIILKRRIKHIKKNSADVKFHICDHSNSPYLKYLPADSTSITCHDVIAIRGALGYSDSFQLASRMGKILQKWIFHHLKNIKTIAFVSQHSLNMFKELLFEAQIPGAHYCVIHNAFNNDFIPMDSTKASVILARSGICSNIPFLLHVGSGSVRKNRILLLDMLSLLQSNTIINCCFAGESLNVELIEYAKKLQIFDKVISIIKPDHETLVALYSSCAAFIFPSLSEGFGWPLIEAQACGAVVLASDTAPMPEVSGGAALHFDPNNAAEFAGGFYTLNNKILKDKLILDGFKNSRRFSSAGMIKAYIDLMCLN